LTVFYDNLEDAQNDVNPRGSEFSFTIISEDDDQFSQEQTDMGIQIYEYMLEHVGQDSYPCDDGTTIADFFDDEDAFESESKSSTIVSAVSLIILLAAMLV